MLKLRIAFTLFVFVGVWAVQTDGYPISDNVRPSWYVYGWPICYATSGRGRFNFSSFDALSLIVDLTISILMAIGTWITAKRLVTVFPKYSISDWLAFTCGFAMFFLAASDSYSTILETFGFDPRTPDYSEMAGVIKSWNRTYMRLPLSLGMFSIGFMLSTVIISVVNKFTKQPKDDRRITTG